jgi:AsmA family protein
MPTAILDEPPTRVEPPATGPGRIIKRLLLAVLIIVAALLLGLIMLPSSVWKRLIVHEVSSTLGRQAAIDGDVQVHLLTWNPQLVVEGFELANADWAPNKPMLKIGRIDITVSLAALLKLQLVFPRIEIDAPDIDLQRDGASRANWDFSSPGARKSQQPGASPPAHIPVIKQLILQQGTLAASDALRKLKFNGQISVAEKQNVADESALRMRGNGILNGKPFDLRLDGGPLINTDASKPYDFDISVTAADIKLTAQTRIQHPFDLAAVTSKLHITGQDLADVYYLTGLALPNTPPYDLAGTAVRDGMKFSIDDFHGRLGGSDINGKLAIDTAPERPKLTATLNSQVLNLADLAAPLGTQATTEKKSATLAVAPKTSKTKNAPASPAPDNKPADNNGLLLPDADLQVARVRGMDADMTFDAASVTTPKLPLKKVHFHLVLDDAKITISPLAFTLPEGTLSGSVSLNARPAVPVTDIDMQLQNLDLTQFKPQSSNTPPLAGELVGRIKLHGEGSSVHKAAADASGDMTFVVPQGQMRSAFAELTGINVATGLGLLLAKKDADTEIRCAVANFRADNGDLKATTLLVDTTQVLITGGGDLNLGTEALDMSLRGQPKKIRLVRLRSPIKIHGSLSHPQIGLQTANVVGQAGGAIALGTLLTPVAALLAFVDPGLAKDANCAGLIGQVEQGKDLPAAH